MSSYDWLYPLFKTAPFTVFDTETTGLEARTNRIIELGGIRFDKKGILSRFNVLVQPGCSIPPEVSKINGITDDMLKGKPEMSQVMPDFLRFIGDSVLIAHNAPFDISFVNEELFRLGHTALTNRVIDTRLLAKELFPGLPKYALQDLARHFGINALEAHRAEDDSRVCMELFLVCIRKLAEAVSEKVGQPEEPVTHYQSELKTTNATAYDGLDDEDEDLGLFDELDGV